MANIYNQKSITENICIYICIICHNTTVLSPCQTWTQWYDNDSDDDNGYQPVDDGNFMQMQIGLDSIIHTNASKKRKHNNKDKTSCSPKTCCETTVLCILFGWWNWRSTLFTPKLMPAKICKPDPKTQHASLMLIAKFVCFALLVEICLFKRHIMIHLPIPSTFAITRPKSPEVPALEEISSDERRARLWCLHIQYTCIYNICLSIICNIVICVYIYDYMCVVYIYSFFCI